LQNNSDLVWSMKGFGQTVWTQIGDLYRVNKHYPEAERFYEFDLDSKRKEATSNPKLMNQYFLENSLEALGKLKAEQKNLPDAIKYLREAIGLLESTRGQQDVLLIPYLTESADLYRQQGSFDDAERLYERARQLWVVLKSDRKSYGYDSDDQTYRLKVDTGFFRNIKSIDYVTVFRGLASVKFSQGKAGEAEKLYLLAITELDSMQKDQPGLSRYRFGFASRREFYTTYAATLRDYAEFLRKTGRNEEAAAQEEKAKHMDDFATSLLEDFDFRAFG